MATVMPGAEPWSAEGNDVGVLVLHGFTGNPVSMRPLAEALAGEGFTIEMPLLPGHGTVWHDLGKTTWHDWVREAAAGLEGLRRRTRARVAVGLSMGAALALRLAETRGEDLSGIVLINPSVFHRDPLKRALPVLKWIVPSMPGVGNDIAKPGGDEMPYEKTSLKAAAHLFELQHVVRRNLQAVTVPMLMFSSRTDHVVDPENGDVILEHIRSAEVERIWLERSYHVATLDYDAELIQERTANFVRKVTAPSLS